MSYRLIDANALNEVISNVRHADMIHEISNIYGLIGLTWKERMNESID